MIAPAIRSSGVVFIEQWATHNSTVVIGGFLKKLNIQSPLIEISGSFKPELAGEDEKLARLLTICHIGRPKTKLSRL